MGLAAPRFTIRSMMIAVAITGGFLGLYAAIGDGLFAALFGLFYIGVIGIWWWMFRGFRRLSALCFGTTVGLANAVCFFLSIYWRNISGFFLISLVWLAFFPLILGAGTAWAIKSTHRGAINRRSPLWVWPLVFGTAMAPLSMLFTQWPFRLAFQVSRPSLERLADRVGNGDDLIAPEWAGMIYVVGSTVDSSTGNVGLIVDPDRSGRSGLVRVGSGVPPEQNVGPFHNLDLNERLGGRWSYQSED